MDVLIFRLVAAELNTGGDLQAATSKVSEYKKLFNKVDMKLEVTIVSLVDLLKT